MFVAGHSTAAYIAITMITVAVIIICIAAVMTLLHRNKILVPLTALCPSVTVLQRWCAQLRLPSVNLFGVRSGRSRMMDDLSTVDRDDDVDDDDNNGSGPVVC